MSMINNDLQQSKKPPLNKIKWLSACPLCKTKFNFSQVKIVAEKKDSFLIHTDCRKCRCSILTSLVKSQMGISSIGLITDLTYKDVLKFKGAKPISADDTIGVFKKLYNR